MKQSIQTVLGFVASVAMILVLAIGVSSAVTSPQPAADQASFSVAMDDALETMDSEQTEQTQQTEQTNQAVNQEQNAKDEETQDQQTEPKEEHFQETGWE